MIRSPISHSCLSHYMRASCLSHSMQQLRGKRILSKNSPNRFSHWCQMEKELRRGDEEEVDDKEEVDKEDGGESQRTSETATETVPVLYSNYFLGTATTTPVSLLEGISTASIASNTLASSTTPTAFYCNRLQKPPHSSPTACQLPISTGDFNHTNTTACTIIYCKCFWDTSMLKF